MSAGDPGCVKTRQSGHRRSQNKLRYPPPDPFQKPKATAYDAASIHELEWRSDMRQKFGHPLDCNCLGRRNFLRIAGGATVAGIAGGSLIFADWAHADALTKDQRDQMAPAQIIEAMKKGNRRFSKGERKERNYIRVQQARAKRQYPAAVLRTCIVSRAPAEWRIDLGRGEVFNVGVARDVKKADALGSMELAC